MGIKTLNKDEMSKFNDCFEGAEMFPNADAWVENIKNGLRIIKPDWTKEDVDGFVDAHFENDPFVNAILRGANFKLVIKD